MMTLRAFNPTEIAVEIGNGCNVPAGRTLSFDLEETGILRTHTAQSVADSRIVRIPLRLSQIAFSPEHIIASDAEVIGSCLQHCGVFDAEAAIIAPVATPGA
jgi:hypothetical protein